MTSQISIPMQTCKGTLEAFSWQKPCCIDCGKPLANVLGTKRKTQRCRSCHAKNNAKKLKEKKQA